MQRDRELGSRIKGSLSFESVLPFGSSVILDRQLSLFELPLLQASET